MSDVSDLIREQAEKVGAAKHELQRATGDLEKATDKLKEDIDDDDLCRDVETLTAVVERNTATLEKEEERLRRLNAIEATNRERAARTEPVKDFPAYVANLKKSPPKPKELLFKSAAVQFLNFVQPYKSPAQILEERFHDDDALKAFHGAFTKTAVAPADTTTVGWAAELVGEAIGELLDSITDLSVGAALRSYARTESFRGQNSIRVPRVNDLGAPLTEPAWVGEGGAIPLMQFGFGSEVINRYKLAGICTCTEELARSAVVDIVALFEREMAKSYAVQLDAALLSTGAAIAGVRPAGLLEGYTAVTPTAGGGVDAVFGDLTALASAMVLAERPVLIVNRADATAASFMRSDLGVLQFADQISGGRLMSFPIISSTHVPQHMAILADAAAIALAFDDPEFTVDRSATIVEANADGTAPTMATDGTGAGDIGTAGQVPPDEGLMVQDATANVGNAGAGGWRARSAFQTWSIFTRMVAPTSFARLRPNMLAHMTATTWT